VYTEGLNFTSVQVKNYHEDYVLSHNPKVDAREIVSSVNKWGKELSVDPKLLLAVAKVESTFDPHAISKSGAYGLMQVIPVWHKEKILQARRELGNPEIFNISTNIYLGAKVLKECLEKTGGVTKALQCYSGQTPGYDAKVLAEYRRLQKI
jgi:soluble lytic murein transglycosylase-like protein